MRPNSGTGNSPPRSDCARNSHTLNLSVFLWTLKHRPAAGHTHFKDLDYRGRVEISFLTGIFGTITLNGRVSNGWVIRSKKEKKKNAENGVPQQSCSYIMTLVHHE